MKNVSNLNAEVFKKNKKRNLKLLIASFVLLGITCLLIYLGVKNEQKELPKLNDMSNLIVNKNHKEDLYSYIDIATKPYLFAVYEENGIEEEGKFYLTMDKENHLYIAYMNNLDFEKLNIDTISDNPIRVTGLTKKIPNEIKEIAIESYNEIMDDEYLNNENFEQYVGLIYLDTISPINDSTLYYLGAILSGIFFIIIIIIYIVITIKNKKFFKNIDINELSQIDAELSQMNNTEYSKMNFYLLKKYIIDMTNNIVILKYDDMLWAYPFEQRYNGMLINKCIKVVDKKNIKYDIANTRLLDKNKDEVLEKILIEIKKKNKDIIIGFNKENKNIVKEKVKNLKASNKV